MSKQTKLYFNKGSIRKRQIYNWLLEVIRGSFFLNQKLNTTIQLLVQNKQNEALSEFTDIIDSIIDNNIDNLGYIIEENIFSFGRDTIIMDLYKGILGSKIRALGKRAKGKIPRRTQQRIDDLDIEAKKEKRKVRFGLRKGKKRKARTLIVIINKKPQHRLQDVKTGKFLGFTKSFKQEIKKSRGE